MGVHIMLPLGVNMTEVIDAIETRELVVGGTHAVTMMGHDAVGSETITISNVAPDAVGTATITAWLQISFFQTSDGVLTTKYIPLWQ